MASELEANFNKWFGEAARRCGVPGSSLHIYADGRQWAVTHGITNLGTGKPVMPETRFGMGSIAKLYTATAVMHLVDQGVVDLDSAVTTYVPEFHLANSVAAESITVRHLLNHTSGIDGDYFVDCGRHAGCIEKYVRSCGKLGSFAMPGELFSYCNAGFVILGRLIECVTGQHWAKAMCQNLLIPIEADKTEMWGARARTSDTAVGHVYSDDGALMAIGKIDDIEFSMAPAGSLATATAENLVRLGRLHLSEGSFEGRQLISPGVVRLMHSHSIPGACPGVSSPWGLGIAWFDQLGKILGHDGALAGQRAFLRIVPEDGLVFALMTNGGDGLSLVKQVTEELLSMFSDITISAPLSPMSTSRLDLDQYAGDYAGVNHVVRVEKRGQVLRALLLPSDDSPDLANSFSVDLTMVARDTFMACLPGTTISTPHRFLRMDGAAVPSHFGFRSRALKRLGK